MKKGTYTAQVSLARHLSGGYCLLTFDLPAAFADAAPGQFVMVRAPGRYPLLARPFSLHDFRRTGRGVKVEILVREVGEGTRALATLGRGDRVPLWGPLGKGFTADAPGPHVLVAGGRGVAPMWFLARRIRADLGKDAALDLFYGACSSEELHYVDEFRELGVRVHTATEDGSRGYKGMVTGLLRRSLGVKSKAGRPKKAPGAKQLGMFESAAPPEPPQPQPKKPPPFLHACGPTPMLAAVHEVAVQTGGRCEVSLESHMACGIGVCLGCAHPVAGGAMVHVCTHGPVIDSRLVFGGAERGAGA